MLLPLLPTLPSACGTLSWHVTCGADHKPRELQVFAKATSFLPRSQQTLLSGLGLDDEARRQMQSYFLETKILSQFLSAEVRPLFEDVEGRVTLAFELVDTMVCAAAQRYVGNIYTAFGAHVCYERNSNRGRQASTDDTHDERVSDPDCHDIYDRPPPKGKLVL